MMGNEKYKRVKPVANYDEEALFGDMKPGCFGAAVFCDNIAGSDGALRVYVERTEKGYDVFLGVVDESYVSGCRNSLEVSVDLGKNSLEVKDR